MKPIALLIPLSEWICRITKRQSKYSTKLNMKMVALRAKELKEH